MDKSLDKPRRRWFRYRLRTLLVLLTVLCVWLGAIVDRAQRQRRATTAIWAIDGLVAYDIEPDPSRWYFLDRFNQAANPKLEVGTASITFDMGTATLDPPTLRQRFQNWLGPDYFVHVTAASVDGRRIDDELVAHLKDLPKLKKLFVHHAHEGDPVLDQLHAALPEVEIIH